MTVRRPIGVLGIGWFVVVAAAVALGGRDAGAAEGEAVVTPAPEGATAAVPVVPTGLETLDLTPLQQRILSQVFTECDFAPSAAPEADLAVQVAPTVPGAIYRRGPEGDLPLRFRATVHKAGGSATVRLVYQVVDFYGRPVAEGTLDPVATDAEGAAVADIVLADLAAAGYYHVSVSATSQERRVEGACGFVVVDPPEGGERTESPFGVVEATESPTADVVEACRRLGVDHFMAPWADEEAVAELPLGLGATGLLDLRHFVVQAPAGLIDAAQVAGSGASLIAHYGRAVGDWQVGGTEFPAAGDVGAEAYRQTVAALLQETRGREVPASLWVAATPNFLGDVLSEGTAMKGADGVSLIVDADAAAPNLRSGAYRRSLDFGIQVGRRFGLRQAWVGATGEAPQSGSPQRQAWKLVTRHVLALAEGAERVYVEAGRGVPEPLASAAVYGRMVGLLATTRYEADLWSDVPLAEAHLFSGAARRVVVLWSWAGGDPAAPDRGALVLEDGFGFEAFDVIGRPVGLWKGRRLIVPFGEAPIYLVTTSLKANEVRDRLRRVRVLGTAPVGLWVRSVEPTDRSDRVRVRLWVRSQRPYRVDATAALLLPPGWTSRQGKQRFGLDPGQVQEVVFECDLAKDAGPPPYEIEAVLEADGAWVRRAQPVQPTAIPRRTIRVGFGLSDWDGISPVHLGGTDGRPAADVWAAYDDHYFYVAARVARERDAFLSAADAWGGDAIQLGFGLRPRADDDFGHPSRGLPAGAFRDTDHLMAITLGEGGAQVVRLRGTQIVLRSHREGNLDPWFGPVEGAEASIVRDPAGRVTLYEVAIPLKALAPLKGQRGESLRFGFRIGSGDASPLDWARAAGTPDDLANPASFLPTSDASTLPCQTPWVLTGPVPGGSGKEP